MHITTQLMPILFILGILGIAFEEQIKINKTATALLTCIALWLVLFLDPTIETTELVEHFGDVSETLFFVLCSMVLVHAMDIYGGFKTVTALVTTTNKRQLLWRAVFLSFFFSALLDNLAAAIVIIAILRKVVPDATDRMKYACLCIIACNAGGSFSPIGDATTLLLWDKGCLTPLHQITTLFLPAMVHLLVPTLLAHFFLFKDGAQLREAPESFEDELCELIPKHSRLIVLGIGILSLLLVPLWQTLWGVPAFMGVIFGLAILWVYTDLMFFRFRQRLRQSQELRMTSLLHGADLTTVLYFLGILMAVAALSVSGLLSTAGEAVSAAIPNSHVLAWIIGVLSSMLDNVALVAATLGMYPVDAAHPAFAVNGSFWTFLAYCAVTGGSLLIIGSATGVTIMGLEGISFGYYFKRFSLLAFLGYLAGALTYLLLQAL